MKVGDKLYKHILKGDGTLVCRELTVDRVSKHNKDELIRYIEFSASSKRGEVFATIKRSDIGMFVKPASVSKWVILEEPDIPRAAELILKHFKYREQKLKNDLEWIRGRIDILENLDEEAVIYEKGTEHEKTA